MSDLRESGSIEQDADVVILLNRPEYYSLDKNNPIRPGEADVIVAKNRHGDVGTAEMRFIKNRMTFAEKDRDWSDSISITQALDSTSHLKRIYANLLSPSAGTLAQEMIQIIASESIVSKVT